MSEVITLDKLLPGQSGIIVFVNATGAIRQRLLEMGFVKGAMIEVDSHDRMRSLERHGCLSTF